MTIRLNQIFDHKTRAAHSPNDARPGMKILNRIGFAMPARQDRRKRFTAIRRFRNHVTLRPRQCLGLKARRLFVLADVKSTFAQNPRHFAKDPADIRNVTRADRLHHDFERARWKHRKIIHRRLHRENLEAVLRGHFAILIEHRCAQIDNGNDRSRCGQQSALQTAARSQTQNLSPAHIAAEPVFGVKDRQRVLQITRQNGARVAILALDPFVPGALVVFEFAPHRNIFPCKTWIEMKWPRALRKPTMKTLTMYRPKPLVCSGFK
jgi:hypothetical protein